MVVGFEQRGDTARQQVDLAFDVRPEVVEVLIRTDRSRYKGPTRRITFRHMAPKIGWGCARDLRWLGVENERAARFLAMVLWSKAEKFRDLRFRRSRSLAVRFHFGEQQTTPSKRVDFPS